MLLTTLLLVSIAVGTGAAILAWRERPKPGALPLVALLAAQAWWSTCIVFRLQADTIPAKLQWLQLGWIGVVCVPVAWLCFALEYTGRDRYLRAPYVAALAIVPAITVVLAAFGGHDLLVVESYTTGPGDVVHFEQGGPWYAVVAGYTYLLGLFGVAAIVELVTSDAIAFRGQGITLLIGLAAPWVTNVGFLLGAFGTGGVDPTPIAFAVSGVAYLGAITRYQLLETNPAPRRRARRLVFDGMREGAIVLDTDGHVVDANGYAIDALGIPRGAVLGEPVERIVPEYDHLRDESTAGHLRLGDDDGRTYDAAVTDVTDVHDRHIGSIVTFHDVSTYVRQRQRLEVLNRILRHNIRTETNVIHGYAERFADGDASRIVQERAERIEAVGEKGRQAVELFERTRGTHTARPLAVILDECVEAVRESYPDIDVSYDRPADHIAVASVLAAVFDNLIENAATHNEGDERTVMIETRADADDVTVVIADDGPGIDAQETDVIRDGGESALRHGSGLGLWIVRWGTEIADGRTEFNDRDPTGTEVTVTVPRLDGA
ncbi:histidine kinase N-terminal 7TM domain-containing protein [Halarchaeum nitratireducens]|uniref:histidine kinase n=1 Tax=Halarchaeum nitratireducens TaxID=489913 RepID=A0A830GAK9_9EURY|nr:histidine kinase N-terminal 7TM domain-containing protein [Halarchaeum nitratireducens]GGN13598.1 PAS domain-containing sensor histidine kinase [Halarchaeum nitratireducens]